LSALRQPRAGVPETRRVEQLLEAALEAAQHTAHPASFGLTARASAAAASGACGRNRLGSVSFDPPRLV
jgi:hypothetical protein